MTDAEKRPLLSYKDISLQILSEGTTTLTPDIASRSTFRRALRWMRKKPALEMHSKALAIWIQENFKGAADRGRSELREGETRIYSAQKMQKGAAFIRLPVGYLGAQKGDSVEVTHNGDHFTVSIVKGNESEEDLAAPAA